MLEKDISELYKTIEGMKMSHTGMLELQRMLEIAQKENQQIIGQYNEVCGENQRL